MNKPAMPAPNKRHLVLAAILLVTLVAAWFAPEDIDEDDSVMRRPAAAGGQPGAGAGTPGEQRASPAVDGTPPSAEDLRQPEERRQRALSALDVDLVRQRRDGAEANDAFASRSWYVAPPPPPPPPPVVEVAPPPPPPPQAPPLPFKHVGRMLEAGRSTPVHYLMEGDRMLIVSDGDLIGGKYRFVGQIGNQIQFIYLPLDVRQNLPIAGAQ